MPPLLQFIIRRLFSACVSLIIITMVLYGGVMLTPPAARARLYLPPGKGGERATEALINVLIRKYHLDEPFPVQYAYWTKSLFQGSWGYSPTLHGDVLPELLKRTPATMELAIYSLLLLIPLGLATGLTAGWRPSRLFDRLFRTVAFLGTSMPPFILSMVLISIFYIKLRWFGPGRMDISTELDIARSGFTNFTGMLTIDGLLNQRFDIFFIALRHLAMPVITLSLFHWATLGRITRSTAISQRNKEYIISARARGVVERQLIWKHALRSMLAPTMTIIVLSAASILTSIYVAEIIFGFPGISQVLVISLSLSPDAPAALGFAVYSVIIITILMFILDLALAMLDPRVREEILKR
jgi:ABC-type dipeptide/oligopeptide/nickel transport system permease component